MLHDMSDRNFLKEQFVKMFSINKGKIPNSLQSLKLNTYVRIVNTDRSQNLFFKGYQITNTTEIFKITGIKIQQLPYLYTLSDLLGNKIKGSFYKEELTEVFLPDIYPINIISKKIIKNKIYYKVSYLGYPEYFNEVIPESEIVKNI